MRERSDCTPAGGGAPAVPGEWVSLFVPDDHALLHLKRALDWEAIKAVRVTHWRAAGKDVDGGGGLGWPVPLYVPMLVLMWIESLHSRQMEKYISESVVARRFLELTEEPRLPIGDNASMAHAEAALGVEGKAAVNTLIIKTAEKLGFTDGKILSADTTVQEPLIGYPNEPVILKGAAERIERALRKLKRPNAQDERRVFRVRSILLLCLFFASCAAYKASGAISTPFGQASVPPSMKNFLKSFGSLRGSKTGPLNH